MRNRFFDKHHEFLTLAQICEITGARLLSDADANKKIFDVATLDEADADKVSFLHSGAYFERLLHSKAAACFVEESHVAKIAAAKLPIILLVHANPYFAYSKLASKLYSEKREEFFAEKLIHPTAEIGEGCVVAANAYIGANVKIGKNCLIGPSASIMSGCIIGDGCIINANAVVSFAVIGSNCIIHNGAKIGQDGFGFAHDKGVNHKIIQLGLVRIGNKVEVGANSCIDRGAIDDTVIGDDVKIDNLVQIAHNVVIGSGTVIAGAASIAGTARVGRFVQIGGGSCIAGHISIGDGVKIAGMSGVMRDIAPMEIVAGIPSNPIRTWHKINAVLLKMINSKGN